MAQVTEGVGQAKSGDKSVDEVATAVELPSGGDARLPAVSRDRAAVHAMLYPGSLSPGAGRLGPGARAVWEKIDVTVRQADTRISVACVFFRSAWCVTLYALYTPPPGTPKPGTYNCA